MARDRSGIVGRRAELARLDDARRAEADHGALVVVRGPAGIGRSALLTAAGRLWSRTGTDVITIRLRDSVQSWDAFAGQPMVDTVREHFERIGDFRLADSINAVSRLCTPTAYDSEMQRSQLLAELRNMFRRVRGEQPVALLIDDVHCAARADLALASLQRAGCLVVATSRDLAEGEGIEPAAAVAATQRAAVASPADAGIVAARLGLLADEVLELGPMADEDVSQLLTKAAGQPVDDALQRALRAGLGPLAGNPGSLLATLVDLRTRERLVSLHGELCLRDPDNPIALPAGHGALNLVARLGSPGRDLVMMAATSDVFGVDDLPAFARATGARLTDLGSAADRLVAAGVLAGDPDGRLSSACPALARSVLDAACPAAEGSRPVTEGTGTDAAARLHARYAEALIDDQDRRHPITVAEHVAAARRSLAPRTDLAELLIAEADRAIEVAPQRAARYFHAALWHAGARHPQRPRIVSDLLHLLVRIGRYQWLEDLTEELAADLPGAPELGEAQRAELAGAIALASIHTGRPVPESTAAAILGPEGTVPDGLEFCRRWFGGGAFADPGLLERVVAPFAADEVDRRAMPRRTMPADPDQDRRPGSVPWLRQLRGTVRREVMRGSLGIADLSMTLTVMLEEGYGAPAGGPVSAFHRVAGGYAKGTWTQALSAAREMEVSGHVQTPAHHVARILSAEMCAGQGEQKRAGRWLAAVPDDTPYVALRGWVQCGMVAHGDDALELGWRAYQEALEGDAPAGIERLLSRMIRIAADESAPGFPKQDWAELLLAELEERHRGPANWATREALFLARGRVHHDEISAKAGADLTSRRGHLPDRACACLVVGRLADEPQPWLHEAHEIARRIGWVQLRDWANELMRGKGVTAPRTRSRRGLFSDTELRIIELIGSGRTNRQIALRVGLSEKTVENYLTRLFAKTGCRSRLDLAAASLEGRLTSVGA
jgi:DNA-binding CsgD family transcriptional regulator